MDPRTRPVSLCREVFCEVYLEVAKKYELLLRSIIKKYELLLRSIITKYELLLRSIIKKYELLSSIQVISKKLLLRSY